MNTTEKIFQINEVNLSDEEKDFEGPRRKPIGWNYQNVFPSHTKKQINGHHEENLDSIEKPNNISSDDIEVLEVKEVGCNIGNFKKSHFPPSSSRKEIKDTIRKTKQASIETFFAGVTKPNISKKPVKFGRAAKVTNKVPSDQPNSTAKVTGKVPSDSPNSTENVSKNISSDCSNSIEKATGIPTEVTEISTDRTESTSNNADNVKENGHVNDKPPSGENSEDTAKEITDAYSRLVVNNFIEKWKLIKTFGRDDKKIEDRLWKHYNACHPSYTHSRKFINAIEKGTRCLNTENLVKFLSSIIDHLKTYKSDPYVEKKKKLKSEVANEEKPEESGENKILDEAELKKKIKMEKIEKAMNKIKKQIQKHEEAEVDLEDEDNSSYLILDRLKRKFCELDALYCKTAECSVATGRPIEKKFKYEGSRYQEINKRIEAWVNKNRTFPDYVDILNLVKKFTKQDSLPLKPSAVRKLAEDIFRDVGRVLKDRREKDDLYCIYAYGEGNIEMDPADVDSELDQKLSNNEKEARNKLEQVFKYFADKESDIKQETEIQMRKKNDIEATGSESRIETELENGEEKSEDTSNQNEITTPNQNEITNKDENKIESTNEGEEDKIESTNGENKIESTEVISLESEKGSEKNDEEEEEEDEEDFFEDTEIDDDNDVEEIELCEEDDEDYDEYVSENLKSPSILVPQVDIVEDLEDTDSKFDESDVEIQAILESEAPAHEEEDEDSEDLFEIDVDIPDNPVAFKPDEKEVDEIVLDTPPEAGSGLTDFSCNAFSSLTGLKRKSSTVEVVDGSSLPKRMKDNACPDLEVVEIE